MNFYDKNLKVLKKIGLDLVSHLSSVKPNGFKIVSSSDGSLNAFCQTNERKIYYLYDQKDAQNGVEEFLSQYEIKEGDNIILVGCGFGYHLRSILQKTKGKVIVLELNLPLFKSSLSLIDWEMLALPNVRPIISEEVSLLFYELCLAVEESSLTPQKTKIIIHSGSLDLLIHSQLPASKAIKELTFLYPTANRLFKWLGGPLPQPDVRMEAILYILLISSSGIKDVYEMIKEQQTNPTVIPLPGNLIKNKVSIIIPVLNNWEFTHNCLNSLFEVTVYPNFEVIVINNGSTDQSGEELKRLEDDLPNLKVINNQKNMGYSMANNQGSKQANGEYLLFLNNDTEVLKSNWLQIMVQALRLHPKFGATGQMTVLYLNDKDEQGVQSVRLGEVVIPVAWCAGYCLMVKHQAFLDVGGFRDDLYGLALYEDIHLAYALREQGWLTVSTLADIGLAHFHGLTIKDYAGEIEEKSRQGDENFKRYWGKRRRLLNCAKDNKTACGLWNRELERYT